MNKKQKRILIRIIIAAVLLVILKLGLIGSMIPNTVIADIAGMVLYSITYLLIGYDILRDAALGIIHGRMFDENFLMAIATVGAIGLAIFEQSGDFSEAVAVMLFYQIGELFQSYAVGKSRKSITDLMDIRPDYANVEVQADALTDTLIGAQAAQTDTQDGSQVGALTDTQNGASAVSLKRIDPDEVEIGTIIVVQPGEKVPLDGIIVEGNSTLNTSALTGESMPRDAKAGDEIVSGCINMTGVLRVRTTKDFDESTVSKILELVEDATSRKSKSENFISKFARVYTPAVCIAALVLALLPPGIFIATGMSPQWHVWIYRALIFLVISCPCALVISIPLTFFAGIGGAGHEGILIKGSNYLETFSKVKTVVFDKTGTLTRGVFEVSEVHTVNEMPDVSESYEASGVISKDRLLELAAFAECSSSHPISLSLQAAYGKDIDRSLVTDIKEISGHGVIAKIRGLTVAAGNLRLMRKLQISAPDGSSFEDSPEGLPSGTVVYVAVDGKYAGYIVISDTVKPNAKATISGLKAAGVHKTVMLTGDSEQVANAVATELGIDEYHSQLLPGDKVECLEKLLEENAPDGDKTSADADAKSSGGKLAFVGDGINDAPVLTRADIGIAMGAMGSDAAIEAADVVLMDDDPEKIVKGIKISRKCLRIVYENIVFALVIKFICLGLGAVGIANMWFAIFADVGVMVIAVINAIRALR